MKLDFILWNGHKTGHRIFIDFKVLYDLLITYLGELKVNSIFRKTWWLHRFWAFSIGARNILVSILEIGQNIPRLFLPNLWLFSKPYFKITFQNLDSRLQRISDWLRCFDTMNIKFDLLELPSKNVDFLNENTSIHPYQIMKKIDKFGPLSLGPLSSNLGPCLFGPMSSTPFFVQSGQIT